MKERIKTIIGLYRRLLYGIIGSGNMNKNVDNEKEFSKMSINWYPGHMAKTRRQIEEDLKIVDIVIELLDSRIPISSRNPDIVEITKKKKKLIVLNKSDLANEKQNQLWVQHFEKLQIPAVLVDSNTGKGIEKCIKKIEEIMADNLKLQADKGRIGRKIRAMVIGIPNVGKSSFINKIAKKSTAEVGNRPGITKQKQWIRINEKIELLDTPGVLWPKFESDEVALHLSFTGTIKDDVLQKVDVAYYLTKFLIEDYREKLCERYKISEELIEQKLLQDKPENENIFEIMLEIGKKRGCIISGGNVDEEKTARILLDEFKNGRLGRITIEKC